MGGNQSIEKNINDYKSSDHIGVYRLFEERGRAFVQLRRQIANEKIYKDWAFEIDKIKERTESQIIYLPLKHQYTPTGFCGSGGTLNIVFDQWQNFLKDQITNRRKNQHFYTEQQIWFILFNLSKLGAVYEPLGRKVGDLHPSNILVTPGGFIKVITRHSLPEQLDNFQKVVEQFNSDVYLAPQQMDENMITNAIYEVKSTGRADSFSFGITLLQAITLENCSYLYIRNPLRISLQKFKIYTNIFKEKYSRLLYNTLMSTLQFDHRYRKTMLEVYNALKPYEANIQELKPFQINESSQAKAENIINESKVSMTPGQGSADNSRMLIKNKQSHVPFSPPTQQIYGFTKKI